MSLIWQPTPRKLQSTLRPFRGEIVELTQNELLFFRRVYEIPTLTAMGFIKASPASGRYVLPIFSPEGHVRGHVLRRPWKDSSQLMQVPAELDWLPKADTFMSKHEPVQSFYKASWELFQNPPLVAVEDQLSAIKLAAAGYDSVALLGTPWSKAIAGYQGADRVAEIARVAGDRQLVVALDADATEAAFEFVRKWGPAFRRQPRVAILSRDLKDTPIDEFAEVLGV